MDSISGSARPRLDAVRRALISGAYAAVVGLLPILPEVVGNALELKEMAFLTAMWTILGARIDAFVELALGGALVGVLVFVWRNTSPNPTKAGPDRKALAAFIGGFHHRDSKVTQPARGKQTREVGENQPIVGLLTEIGILRKDAKGLVATSRLADAFLCSLAAHLNDKRPNFLCEWNAEPRSPGAESALALVRQIEINRIAGRHYAEAGASRNATAALAVIRMDIANVPHVLLIKSDQWNRAGGWWWPGGTEEIRDERSLTATVRREVKEELGLATDDDAAILEIKPLFSSRDLRLSGSLGLLTEYDFHLFAVRLKDDHPRVQPLLIDNPKVTIYYPHATRVHEFKWTSITDVLNEPHLKQHAPHVMTDFANRITPADLPKTASRA